MIMPHFVLFLSDSTRKKMLKWPTRFKIIQGIARGIMYLHQDSRLRIIHRDLKASNILLDKEMSPKIYQILVWLGYSMVISFKLILTELLGPSKLLLHCWSFILNLYACTLSNYADFIGEIICIVVTCLLNMQWKVPFQSNRTPTALALYCWRL